MVLIQSMLKMRTMLLKYTFTFLSYLREAFLFLIHMNFKLEQKSNENTEKHIKAEASVFSDGTSMTKGRYSALDSHKSVSRRQIKHFWWEVKICYDNSPQLGPAFRIIPKKKNKPKFSPCPRIIICVIHNSLRKLGSFKTMW